MPKNDFFLSHQMWRTNFSNLSGFLVRYHLYWEGFPIHNFFFPEILMLSQAQYILLLDQPPQNFVKDQEGIAGDLESSARNSTMVTDDCLRNGTMAVRPPFDTAMPSVKKSSQFFSLTSISTLRFHVTDFRSLQLLFSFFMTAGPFQLSPSLTN